MNDKIIYIHRDKNLVTDVFQWQEGKELELIKFGVECKFKEGKAILINVGEYHDYNLEPGDYILKWPTSIYLSYQVLPEAEFNEHVKKYSLKLIEATEVIDIELSTIVCMICEGDFDNPLQKQVGICGKCMKAAEKGPNKL